MQTPAGTPGHPLLILSLLYVALGGLGLALTRSGAFGKAFVYIFGLLDMLVIAAALTMQSHMPFGAEASEFRVILFALLFVLLILTALRQKPYLAIVTVVGFLFAYLFGPWIMSFPHADQMHSNEGLSAGTALLSQETALVLILIAIAATILHFVAIRTRELTEDAISEGHRAAHLSRYFSPEVAQHLSAIDYGRTASGRRCQVGILFVDIRDFTRLSEQASPDELAELLASFREVVSDVIFEHGGIVDKFIGDAVLAVFGTLRTSPDDAERTALAAIAICRAVETWRVTREQSGKLNVRVGVGGHFGEVFTGIIPSGAMFEHSVIGDSVNLAQRIERLTRTFDCDIALSEYLVETAGIDPAAHGFATEKDVSVAGHHAPITIFCGRVG